MALPTSSGSRTDDGRSASLSDRATSRSRHGRTCPGHPRESGAARMAGTSPAMTTVPVPPAGKPLRGQSLRRIEDARFLTGRARYVEDIDEPQQTWMHVVRSPHAHATITHIDTTTAQTIPGVLGIFTAADLADLAPLPCNVPVASLAADDRAAAPRPRHRPRAACRRPGRIHRRGNPRRRAQRRGIRRRGLRRTARGRRRPSRATRRRAANLGPGTRQPDISVPKG